MLKSVVADGLPRVAVSVKPARRSFAEEKTVCDYCGGAINGISDLIERAAERVLEMQGKVEEVRGPDCRR